MQPTVRGPVGRFFLDHTISEYPQGRSRAGYLAVAVLASIVLYYAYFVQFGVTPNILASYHMSFNFFIYIDVASNLLGAFASLFASGTDRVGRSNVVIYGLLAVGLLTAVAIPLTSGKWVYLALICLIGIVEGAILVATPALALVAAASVLCGYRWLGVFPSGDTRLSALAFGRWGALTFAVLAGTVAVVATRAAGRRRTTGRGWMVGSAGLLLVTAAALVIHADTATRPVPSRSVLSSRACIPLKKSGFATFSSVTPATPVSARNPIQSTPGAIWINVATDIM